jgi:hypothetical protein
MRKELTMWHMPYERMAVGDEADDTPDNYAQREAPPQGEPGRTPGLAEGADGEERKMPQGEPGPTPGSAEGGGLDEPSRH